MTDGYCRFCNKQNPFPTIGVCQVCGDCGCQVQAVSENRYHCPGCGRDTKNVVTDMFPVCGQCGRPVGPAVSEAPAPIAPRTQPRAAARPVAQLALPAVEVAGRRGIVKQARLRIRELNTEIRRLKALIKERDELQRLVAAAKNKTKKMAPVQQMPKTRQLPS